MIGSCIGHRYPLCPTAYSYYTALPRPGHGPDRSALVPSAPIRPPHVSVQALTDMFYDPHAVNGHIKEH